MAKKTTKVITRRKKFTEVDIPIIRSKIELIGNSEKELENRTIKLDLTRQLKGKSVEVTVKIIIEDGKAIAIPKKIKLMSYFIVRMIRKRISYVEDSFEIPSQESMIRIKPFLITRKKVSRAVRKTLRNKTRNWLEDYISERKDSEIFSEILSNKIQRPLSLVLKKTYPLSLCEIRMVEIKRKLEPNEIPKIERKIEKVKEAKQEEDFIDQMKEIEEEKIKRAEKEIKETQEKADKKEKSIKKSEEEDKKTKETKTKKKTEKKTTKTTTKKEDKKTAKETKKK